MRKILRGLAAGALLTAGTAGCAAGHAAPAPPRGTVTGRLQIEGGPTPQAGLRGLPGTVQFTGGRHRPVAVATSPGGQFTARLAPGTYRVSGRSSHIREQLSNGRLREVPCTQPTAVTIIARRTATVTLTCVVP